jgi:hypothetical protein
MDQEGKPADAANAEWLSAPVTRLVSEGAA